MAITLNCTCTKCGKNWDCSIVNGTIVPTICDECKEKEKDDIRKIHFSELDKLTLEERVRKLEELVEIANIRINTINI